MCWVWLLYGIIWDMRRTTTHDLKLNVWICWLKNLLIDLLINHGDIDGVSQFEQGGYLCIKTRSIVKKASAILWLLGYSPNFMNSNLEMDYIYFPNPFLLHFFFILSTLCKIFNQLFKIKFYLFTYFTLRFTSCFISDNIFYKLKWIIKNIVWITSLRLFIFKIFFRIQVTTLWCYYMSIMIIFKI